MMYMFRFEWKTNRQGGTTSSLHQLSVFFSMQVSRQQKRLTTFVYRLGGDYCRKVQSTILPRIEWLNIS